MLPTPSTSQVGSPSESVDLWAALDRLGRDDRAMLAERRDDVRRSRIARRAPTVRQSESA